MTAYYNEFDRKTAAWLRELIADGLIAPGEVDERSIVDVKAEDLKGFTQAHFFAGIGGWSYALRLAGWPDDVPVWTGSCPCQGLSTAGKGLGAEDERHLWPEFHRLIRECRPPVCFGEQVSSAIGLGWIAGVRVDLEEEAYAVGAADLCAAGVGAPHIRQRLYWVADAADSGCTRREHRIIEFDNGEVRIPWKDDGRMHESCGKQSTCRLGLSPGQRPQGSESAGTETKTVERDAVPWSSSIVIPCRDGKSRRIPTQSAFFPLVDGLSTGRVGLLRGAGNAIVPQVAAEFIRAYCESRC
jgi:DNA (cytosine-5)-methyltransferase 1